MNLLEYSKAAVEVLDILDNTKKSDVEKIPLSFLKFLTDIASEDYVVNLDHSKPIGEMELQEKTREILGTIYINWWSNKEEKEQYAKRIKEINLKKEEEKRIKYDPNKIFENRRIKK